MRVGICYVVAQGFLSRPSHRHQFLTDGADGLQYFLVSHGRWALASTDVLCKQALRHAQATGNGRGVQLGMRNEEVVQRIRLSLTEECVETEILIHLIPA